MSKDKSNATVERPDVIPIASLQCFPGSDLTLMAILLSNCAYYLYLELRLSGSECNKLNIAIALNAEPVKRIQAESSFWDALTLMAVQKAGAYVTCKHVGDTGTGL